MKKSLVCLLLITSILLVFCACGESNDFEKSSTIVSGPLGYLYDEETGITISDNGELIVLENCEVDSPKFTLPTEFSSGLKMNYVGDGSFGNCDEIVELVIPDGYEEIGQFAFMGCDNLESVYIGKDVFRIWDLAFTECPKLKKIRVSPENPYLYEKDGCVIEKESQKLVATNGNTPEGIKAVGACVFGGSTVISEITVPDGVELIEGYAFDRSSVTSITLPDSLKQIDQYAFSQCTNLKEIYIPASVIQIDRRAFAGTNGIIINCEAESQPDTWSIEWLKYCEDYRLNWGVERE